MSATTYSPASVLDPIDRSSEAIFGVLMAVTITGSLSAATAGAQEIHTMMLTALGCNLAWGLTDAVMYLVAAATEHSRTAMQLRRLGDTTDLSAAHRAVADLLPRSVAEDLRDDTLEEIRRLLIALPLPRRALAPQDYVAALGVFALVVLVTFPVVVPFLIVRDVPSAMRVSNAVALAVLYAYGHVLGKFAGGTAWRTGLVIAAIGVGLIAVIMALGG